MILTKEIVLSSVWKNQIRLVAGKVLLPQGNDMYALSPKTMAAFEDASSENRHSLENLNLGVSNGFILNHLNELRDAGEFNLAKGKRVISFCINSNEAKEAFKDARNFWLSKGVPDSNIVNGVRESKKFGRDELGVLLKECHEMLKEKYLTCPEVNKKNEMSYEVSM